MKKNEKSPRRPALIMLACLISFLFCEPVVTAGESFILSDWSMTSITNGSS